MGPGTDDHGAILLLVLLVTTVLAVVIGVILTVVEVNLRNTEVARNIDDKAYAADAGVEYAIQKLRQDATLCPDPTGTPWSSSMALNGVTVDVSCATTAGVAATPSNWAAVAETSLSTAGGGTAVIDGPTYVAGDLTVGSGLNVNNGLLLQRTPCSVTAPPAVCVPLSAPAVNVDLPQISFAPRNADGAYTVTTPGGADCTIFLPGKYTALTLPPGSHNYFVSGIYYFENVGTIGVDGIDLFGGNRGASEVALVDPASASACAGDHDAGVSDGDGVEWILGGTSAISVSSNNGTYFELSSRVPGTSPYGSEGTAGVSIRSVPAGAAGYVASSLGSTPLFSNLGGGGTQVGVHGLVYGPGTRVNVSATDTGAGAGAILAGGVVAADLHLNASTGGNTLLLSRADDTTSKRFIVITSTAQGGGASKNVTTTAVVEFGNDASRTVVVDSWVTNQS